jgi:hypothetical protein
MMNTETSAIFMETVLVVFLSRGRAMSAEEYEAKAESNVEALIWNGWEVKRCKWNTSFFQWRSPRGISGSEWVSKFLYVIPKPVLEDAERYSELTIL